MSRLACCLALALFSAPALAAGPHPDVGAKEAADACETCHLRTTPEAVKQWEAGKHGLLLVKCVACHGSTGRDFALRPAAARCAGCHPDQVEAIVPARAARRTRRADCFPCHAPHALTPAEGAVSPHRAR